MPDDNTILYVGLAIVVLVIGIPIGLYMLLRPKHVWWTFESWKYKNPEANEPSETAYGLSALSGGGVIVAAIILAWVAWSTEKDQRAAEDRRQVEAAEQKAIDEYVAPKPENRGQLPVIGYVVTPQQNGRQTYEVFFLQPPDVYPADIKNFGAEKGWFNCVTRVGESRKTNPVTVSAHLSWEPTAPPDDGEADKCTVDALAQSSEIDSEFFSLETPSPIVTDSAIVDVNGKVLMPAGPGNAVPKLEVPPRR